MRPLCNGGTITPVVRHTPLVTRASKSFFPFCLFLRWFKPLRTTLCISMRQWKVLHLIKIHLSFRTIFLFPNCFTFITLAKFFFSCKILFLAWWHAFVGIHPSSTSCVTQYDKSLSSNQRITEWIPCIDNVIILIRIYSHILTSSLQYEVLGQCIHFLLPQDTKNMRT